MIVGIQRVRYLLDRKFDNLGETVGIKYSHVGKHLAVQFHTGLFQTTHQLAVARTILFCRSTDAGYPESTEVSFLVSPVTVGITEGPVNSFRSCFL